MLRYRRGRKMSGTGINSISLKDRRHRSGRQQGQGQTHNFSHHSQDARTWQGRDGGYGQHTHSSAIIVHQPVLPSPASLSNAPAIRLGPSYNTNHNSNVSQFGKFHAGN